MFCAGERNRSISSTYCVEEMGSARSCSCRRGSEPSSYISVEIEFMVVRNPDTASVNKISTASRSIVTST
jgi:hypothetical protein